MSRPIFPLLSSVVAMAACPEKQKEIATILTASNTSLALCDALGGGLKMLAHLYKFGLENKKQADDFKMSGDEVKANHHYQVFQAFERSRVCFEKSYKKSNTSVTTGIANEYLHVRGDKSALLNCGTGGVKYQAYELTDDGISADVEYKPESVSLSAVLLPDLYVPNDSHAVKYTVDEAAKKIRADLETQEFSDKCKGLKTRAVITGEIRQAYENASKEKRDAMDVQMNLLFKGPELAPFEISPWKGESFFITQEEEGVMEVCAVSALIKAIDQESEGVFGGGTGKGSTQIVEKILDEKGCESLHVTKFPYGLLKSDNYKNLPEFVVDDFKNNMETLTFPFARKVSTVTKPVFGLKSGFLLATDGCPELKKLLTSADDFVASKQASVELDQATA